MKTRREQIEDACKVYIKEHFQNDAEAFSRGAEWADANPQPLLTFDMCQAAVDIAGGKLTYPELEQKLAIAVEALEAYREAVKK